MTGWLPSSHSMLISWYRGEMTHSHVQPHPAVFTVATALYPEDPLSIIHNGKHLFSHMFIPPREKTQFLNSQTLVNLRRSEKFPELL